MSRLIKRLERKIDLFGETVAINGAVQIKAFVQALDTGRMHTYLDTPSPPLWFVQGFCWLLPQALRFL